MRFVVVIVLTFLSFIVMIPSVQAAVGITIRSDEACSVTPGRYSIGVTNEQGFADTLRVTVLGAQRGWVTAQNTKLELNDGESGTFELSAAAPEGANSGFYYIPVVVYSDTNESLQEGSRICLIVKAVDRLVLRGIFFEDDTVTPGETLKLSVTVANIGTEPFKNIDLKLEVVGPQTLDFADDVINSLAKNEETTVAREVQIHNLLNPGQYLVRATLIKDDEIFDTAERAFTIETVKQVDRDVDERSGTFTFTRTVKLRNTGNAETVESVTAEVARPFNAFTSAPGALAEERDGSVVYTWFVTLGPNESASVTYTVHYWPFYVVFAVIIFAAYRFYITSRRPSIRKRLMSSKRLHDDRQEFAISLEVKNTTPFTLRNVTVLDFVPAVARVYKDFKVQPERAKFVEVGTEILWKFREMKPGEVRYVHYRMATVLETIERFLLPSAVVEGWRGRRRYRVHSNDLMVGSKKDVG